MDDFRRISKPKQESPIAKVTVPRLGKIYPRLRLFEFLDTACERPVVWISAPPGAGKTTLVASYLAERHLASLWYQVDEGDADIANFFYYLGLAAKQVSPARRHSLPLFTPEYALGVSTFARRYFEQLCRGFEPPFAVVLDNYQTVATDSPLHEVIASGLEVIPEGCNVIIISREDPPPAFARLRVNQHIGMVGWEVLQLDDEETRQVARLLGTPELAAKGIEELRAYTGGWMAGLVLLMEAMRSQSRKENAGIQIYKQQSPQVIFDYFAIEIFEKKDAATQDLLLKSALFARMTPKMISDLTGILQTDSDIDQFMAEQHFVGRHVHNEIVYQYHPLFREFLLTQLQRTFSEEELSGLRSRAAGILEASGQIESAAKLYLSSCDWEESIRLICTHAQQFVLQGRGETIIRWIRKVPDQVVKSTPWLKLWLGVAQIGTAPLEARKPLEEAYWDFKEAPDIAGMCLALGKLVESFSYGWYDMYPLDGWVGELECLLASHPELPSQELQALTTVSMFGALSHRRPNHRDMAQWTQRTREVVRRLPHPSERLIVGMQLATYYVWWGRHNELTLLLDELRPAVEGNDVSDIAYIALHTIEAMYYTRSLAGDGVQTTRAALQRAAQSGVYVMNPLLLGFAALASLNAGALDSAEDQLAQLRELLHPARPMDQAFYYWLRGHLAWLRDDIQGACEYARQCAEVATKSGSVFHELMTPISLAKILVEAHEFAEADEVVGGILPAIRDNANQSLEYECLLVLARLAFLQRDMNEGYECLGQALRLMKLLGEESTIWWNPEWIVPLLAKALSAGIESEYVRSLISRHHLVPEEGLDGLEKWPWPVRITTFGRFGLLIDEKNIPSGRKGHKKPIELLMALIAFGGKDVGDSQVCDALWPDAEGDDAHHSLKTTLHRLRGLLGIKNAIRVGNGKLSLDSRYCWVDVAAFESLLAATGTSGDDFAERADRLQRAIDLYSGAFLEMEADENWLLSTREHLRERYLHAVEELGRYHEDSEHWDRAIAVYEQGISAESLAEGLYERLMICQAELGRRGEALLVFERYKKLLSSSLGIEPPERLRRMALKLQL